MRSELFSVFMLILVGEMVSGDELSAATSEFSQNLYQVVALKKENVVYSPLSIHQALTLSRYGAGGTTATQMDHTLSLTQLAGSAPHWAYHDLIVQLNSVRDVELYTSNALFLNPHFIIEPDFVREAQENYFSLASNFDLDAPGGPEKPINDFVKDTTHGTIKEILPPGSVDGSTTLVLVNTLFFNGTWNTQFEQHKTKKQVFNQLNGGKSQVDMMIEDINVYIKKDDQNLIDIVQLPFKNKRFGLYIVLPREVEGIETLESLLISPNSVDGFFQGLEFALVALRIPKFKIETKLSLVVPLQKLGMKDAFTPGLADFSGISPGSLFISDVLHKAVIEVQETGTVAAAATAIIINFTSAKPEPEYTFTADHPFLFFLRDNETKQILFQGKFSG